LLLVGVARRLIQVVEVVVPVDLEPALYRFPQVLIQLLLAVPALVVQTQETVKILFFLLLLQQAVAQGVVQDQMEDLAVVAVFQ
jgi:hypothetical protein